MTVSTGSLEGKIALVTGAAQGQGEEIARLMAARGARVVIADIRREDGERVARSIGSSAMFVPLDVADASAWAAAVAAAEAQFGSVTVLANNAGIFVAGPIEELTGEAYRRIIHINQVGPLLGVQAVLPGMKAAGGGAIVNTGSLAGQHPIRYGAAYSSTKAAVSALTRVAAAELATYGVRVNCISPGAIDTPMMAAVDADQRAAYVQSIPLGRFGNPIDIAKMVCFLVSDEASWITGSDFVIDGGQHACQ